MEFTVRNTVAMILAISGMVGAAVCFKLSADLWDNFTLKSIAMLLGGAVIGLLHPIGATIALRGHNANVVFATIGGPGLIVTQVVLACVFRYPLAWWHWGAIAMIVLGIALLQGKPRDAEATSQGSSEPMPW